MKLKGLTSRKCKICGEPITEASTSDHSAMRDEVYSVGDVVPDCPPPYMFIKCAKHQENPYVLDVYPIMKNHVWTGKVVGLNKNHKWAHDYVSYLVRDMLDKHSINIEKLNKVNSLEHKIGELGRFFGDLCEELESLREKVIEIDDYITGEGE